jgi:hypothetical protein
MNYDLKYVDSILRLHQIDKIIDYANNFLNIDVYFVDPKSFDDSGEYVAPEGVERGSITIVDNLRGIPTILTLLHELGHHIDFLKRGYVEEEEYAYGFYPEKRGESCPVKYRDLIKHVEDEANRHSYEISQYLDIKIPLFSFIKDVIYQRECLDYSLKFGSTTKEIRREMWRIATKKAKYQMRYQNPVSRLFATK